MYLFSLIVIFKITKLLAVFLNVPLGKWGRGVPVMLLVLFFWSEYGCLGGAQCVTIYQTVHRERWGRKRENEREEEHRAV